MILFTAFGIISGEMFITVGTLTFQYFFNHKKEEKKEGVAKEN